MCLCVSPQMCICVFAKGRFSQIPLALLTHSHPKKKHYTHTHTLTDHYISLSPYAKTVSMLWLTTQQALIPLPVTFYKQD